MKGHFLNCELTIEHGDKKAKKIPIGKLGGEIEYTLPNRKRVVLPFGSFVKNFLDEVHDIAGTNSAGAPRRVNGVARKAVSNNFGIIFGASLSKPKPLTTTDISRVTSDKLGGASNSYSAMVMPENISYTIDSEKDLLTYYFDMSRTFTNGTTITTYTIDEVYLAASNVTGAGRVLYSIDKYKDVVQLSGGEADSLAVTPGSVVTATFRFQMTRSYSTGGALMGLAKMIYNVLMSGSLTALNLQRYNNNAGESTYANYAMYLGGSESTGKYHGIVVGYLDKNIATLENAIPQEPQLYDGGFLAHTGLTMQGNVLGSVVQVGDVGAQFTISRTIVNSSTASKTITHIGLFGHGGTPSTTGLNNNAIPYALNRVTPIVLAPNQTLRITYTFSVEI